jgi:hypothetical protein
MIFDKFASIHQLFTGLHTDGKTELVFLIQRRNIDFRLFHVIYSHKYYQIIQLLQCQNQSGQ